MVNIILADQQRLVRSGLKTLLVEVANHGCITEADTFEEALHLLHQSKTHFLITEMAADGDPERIVKALAIDPGLKVLVLSDHDDFPLIQRTFANGASAFLLKECLYEELLLAMRCASNGRNYLCSGISSRLLELTKDWAINKDSSIDKRTFTERELEVLELIGEGKTNMEMSEQLFLSKRTIEGHRQKLLDKTKSRNTAQLVRFAVRNGILH